MFSDELLLSLGRERIRMHFSSQLHAYRARNAFTLTMKFRNIYSTFALNIVHGRFF